MKNKYILIYLVLIITILLSGCGKETEQDFVDITHDEYEATVDDWGHAIISSIPEDEVPYTIEAAYQRHIFSDYHTLYIYEILDNETGITYIIFDGYLKGIQPKYDQAYHDFISSCNSETK